MSDRILCPRAGSRPRHRIRRRQGLLTPKFLLRLQSIKCIRAQMTEAPGPGRSLEFSECSEVLLVRQLLPFLSRLARPCKPLRPLRRRQSRVDRDEP